MCSVNSFALARGGRWWGKKSVANTERRANAVGDGKEWIAIISPDKHMLSAQILTALTSCCQMRHYAYD